MKPKKDKPPKPPKDKILEFSLKFGSRLREFFENCDKVQQEKPDPLTKINHML